LTDPKEFIIGSLRALSGVLGDFTVSSYSGEFDHFFSLKHVILQRDGKRQSAEIEYIDEVGKGLRLHLKGVETADAAQRLVGSEIVVQRDQAAPLAAGELYAQDLIGAELRFEGRALGKVEAIIEGGPYDYLETRRLEGDVSQTVLVPYIKQFIGKVDTSAPEAVWIELLHDWVLE
jgi:16S rRNA processing protein RimM